MTSLQDLLKRAGADLDALGAGWALIGGLAVSARSQPRFTGDVDLAVSVSGRGSFDSSKSAAGTSTRSSSRTRRSAWPLFDFSVHRMQDRL